MTTLQMACSGCDTQWRGLSLSKCWLCDTTGQPTPHRTFDTLSGPRNQGDVEPLTL